VSTSPSLPAPPPAPLENSIARQEFASAITRLSGRPLDDARGPLPLRYSPPRREPPTPIAARHHPVRPSVDDTIGSALDALTRGDLTVGELLAQTLHNIDQRDTELHAIVELLDVSASADAARLDRELRDGSPRRPLHGIPVTVKDVIDVAGLPTAAGSAAYLAHPDRGWRFWKHEPWRQDYRVRPRIEVVGPH